MSEKYGRGHQPKRWRKTLTRGTGDTADGGPPGGARPMLGPGDQQASQRVRLATLMMRRGDALGDIAAATDVPVAMLQLLRAEQKDAATDRQEQRWDNNHRRVTYARRVILTVAIIDVAATANIIACVTALIHHNHRLGALTGLLAIALLAAVYLVAKPAARTLRPPVRGRRPPPPQP